MAVLVPTGRDLEDIKDALNMLILVCRDNSEFSHYEEMLLNFENDMEILSYGQEDISQ